MIVFVGTQISDTQLSLHDEEIAHCTKILRKRQGDAVVVHDGIGHVYTGHISSASKSEVLINIESVTHEEQLLPLHLAISLTKNIDRIEWLVSKAVEIGVTHISFLDCHRSERNKYRHDRIQNIALSAAKQSLKYWFPIIQEGAQDFKSWLAKLEPNDQNYIASYAAKNPNLLEVILPAKSSCILIGPEGDFTPDEVRLALAKGFQPVNLGNQRLRTETAGLYAATLLRAVVG